MNILNTLKLDTWWKVILWCGVALVASGLVFHLDVINSKHIIGLGIGMFIVGISNFAALKTIVVPQFDGYWKAKKPIHNITTFITSCVGWLLIFGFGGGLIWSLI